MTHEVILGDCLDVLPTLASGSVDCILADPPYGTTACKWDSIIPLEPMWKELKRVIKPRGAVVMTASQPFTTMLIASCRDWFKYCWVWVKNDVTGFANAKRQPLRCTEDVIVFCGGATGYNPQELKPFGKRVTKGRSAGGSTIQGEIVGNGRGSLRSGDAYLQEWTNYPRSVLDFSRDSGKLHPTQKPVALMAYLIRTYTNEGETVLDFCCGSGTTGVAARQEGRNFIGIEKEPAYVEIARRRIAEAQAELPLFAEAKP